MAGCRIYRKNKNCARTAHTAIFSQSISIKMKAYLSYSVGESQKNVIMTSATKLRAEGYTPISGILNDAYENDIRISDLFLGIATLEGNTNDKTFKEWQIAQSKQVPKILLAEKGVILPDELSKEDVFIYDPSRPEDVQKALEKRIQSSQNNKSVSGGFWKKYWAWIVGGTVVVSAVLLLILYYKDKEALVEA